MSCEAGHSTNTNREVHKRPRVKIKKFISSKKIRIKGRLICDILPSPLTLSVFVSKIK